MTATTGQMSCASSFFIWILSTDEPKDFRLPGTISVCQVRCGSIHFDFFQTLRCKRLTDHSVQFLGLLLARTLVGTDSIKCAVQGVILLDDLPGALRALSKVECVVGVFHAPIITEPQAISSLGSDIFQIVFGASRRCLTGFERRSGICS